MNATPYAGTPEHIRTAGNPVIETSVASALQLSEQQGSRERSCLATCSLPVPSAEALCVDWELECTRLNVWRNKALESRQYVWASRYEEIIDAYSRCVKDLRREMERATERQPE